MELGYHDREQLKETVFSASMHKQNFKTACAEWEISSHFFSEDDVYCTCGMRIKEVFVIKNTLTEKELTIGNVCIQNFENDLVVDEAKTRHGIRSYEITTGMNFSAIFMGYDKYQRCMFKIRRGSVVISQLNYAAKVYSLAPPYLVKDMYRVSIKDKRLDSNTTQLEVGAKYTLLCKVAKWEFKNQQGYHLIMLDCQDHSD